MERKLLFGIIGLFGSIVAFGFGWYKRKNISTPTVSEISVIEDADWVKSIIIPGRTIFIFFDDVVDLEKQTSLFFSSTSELIDMSEFSGVNVFDEEDERNVFLLQELNGMQTSEITAIVINELTTDEMTENIAKKFGQIFSGMRIVRVKKDVLIEIFTEIFPGELPALRE